MPRAEQHWGSFVKWRVTLTFEKWEECRPWSKAGKRGRTGQAAQSPASLPAARDSLSPLPPCTPLLLQLVSPFHPALPGFSCSVTLCRLHLPCGSCRGKSPWDMHLQARDCVCSLFSEPPHPICQSPMLLSALSPHCCQCPAFPLPQTGAL